jgi:preprotein translocase subunit Sec63
MMSFLKNIVTSLLWIHSSFLHIFYFSKYFKSVNSKSPILKFDGDRICQITVKFAKFVNTGDVVHPVYGLVDLFHGFSLVK